MRVGSPQRLFRHEAAGGIVLMLASGLALALANSPLAGIYDLLLSLHASVRIGEFAIEKPLLLCVGWVAFYGTSVLTGIGFTTSLFIGALAFGDSAAEIPMRLGVLVGSGLSALVGAGVLTLLPCGRTRE